MSSITNSTLVRFLGVALISATLLFVAAQLGVADDTESLPKGLKNLGHQPNGEEHKRISGSGEGMPSFLGPFPDTLNMEFLGQVTNADMGLEKLVFTGATFLSDIWGWNDTENGHEYAIVGTTSGVAFVRVTDPTNPEFLGLVPTTNPATTRNFWWDVKSNGNFAYWTTEVNDAPVFIFDLTRLDALGPVAPGTNLFEDATFDDGGKYVRAHNIAINEDSERAYLVGVTHDDFEDDAILILDIAGANALAPTLEGVIDSNTEPGVEVDSHDVQVVTYNGPDGDHTGDEILINFNGGALNIQIWDVSNPAFPILLSETGYPGASFAHQGWLTEDHRYVVFGDEEDELFGISDPKNPDLPDTARTYFCDISDLDNIDCNAPVTFDSPAASIDHNLFVKGDRVYQAHYTAGVRVLEIDKGVDGTIDQGDVSEIAHMDTEPRLPNKHMNKNINIFVGPWGVFPFFGSDTIAASDGLNGLILMRVDD